MPRLKISCQTIRGNSIAGREGGKSMEDHRLGCQSDPILNPCTLVW